MTVSGSTSFNPTFADIVSAALRRVGVIETGEKVDGAMYADAVFVANALVKEWMATGIHVWTEEEAILFLQPGQSRYLISLNSADHCPDAYSYAQATLAANAITGATSLAVSTITGFVNGTNIGVVLDAGSTFWTTISGVPSGLTVHLAAPLPSQASAGEYTFSYASNIVRPLRIPFARRLAFNGNILTPMIVMSRSDYFDLPNPSNAGTPTQMYYSPQLVDGQMSIWPVTTSDQFAVRFTYYRPLDDFTDQANTADFPQEWVNCLTWNLARELAPEYGVPPQPYAIIEQRAAESLDRVSGWDREPESVYFGYNTDSTAR